jgi:translation initiation factor 4A
MSNNTDNTENELPSSYPEIESFEDLSISKDILRGIFAYGFERPSPIQRKAINPVLAGRDVIAQAQSGMGKTATFCIGTLGLIDPQLNEIQACVLVHTRELALQVDTVFRYIGKYTDLRINLSVKGILPRENMDSLQGVNGSKPHIVIGTPGRVLDMIRKSALNTEFIKIIVFDEADELLTEGFIEQTQNIVHAMPPNVQISLFSATMSSEFFSITNKFMRDPVNILVKTDELTLEGIKQFYIDCEKNEYKFDTLCDIFSVLVVNQSIIYCNSQKIVEYLNNKLVASNFTVSFIHGGLTSQERELTMSDFRKGKTKVLLTTDLLGRGIDVQQVSVVINYDIPSKVESYIHRIGRSGRYGRKGVAINFVTYYDRKRMTNIEQYYNTELQPLPSDIGSLVTN